MPARMATQDTREGYSSAVSHNNDNDNGIRLEVPTSHRPLLSDRRTPSVSSVSDGSQQDGNSLPSTGLRPARSFNVNRGWAHFDVKRGIYLKTPFLMISLFFLGLFAAVGHHAFYTSLDHGQVGSQSQQEWNLRFGSAFAYVTQISLVASVGIAYTQWLWRTLSTKALTVECLDAAFDADQAIVSLLNREFVRKVHVGAGLALLCWALQLPSLATPATLNVQPTLRNDTLQANVSSLNMVGKQWSRFAISFDKIENEHILFAGPRTVVQRLVTATATEGIVLPILPPYLNSSYQLEIEGPAIRCQAASDDTRSKIETLRQEAHVKVDESITLRDNCYYGFVPSYQSPFNISAIDTKRLQEPISGSNQFWMVYTTYQNGTEGADPGMRLKLTNDIYTTCTLHRATYGVNFNFTQGVQNISKTSETIHEAITYPQRNETKSDDLNMRHAYSAIMWAISDLLIGKMSTFTTADSDGFDFSEISTQIAHTSLLGSSDLRVFFDRSRYKNTDGDKRFNASDQTLEDISRAGSRSLVDLIHELAFNVTVSFMSSPLLSPKVITEVARSQSIITYNYSSRNLFIAYGMAILTSFVANVLGLYALWLNKASYARTFSARVITTRGIKLVELVHDRGDRGLTAPLEPEIMHMKIKFDTKIWGFVRVGEGGDETEEVPESNSTRRFSYRSHPGQGLGDALRRSVELNDMTSISQRTTV